ncbi:MAG: leucine-rich repeat domain-containing protein [Proteobacteria bacterium]|nr:leucine-rich repeat domain-containing protein [Pseudomonadota bacterium]
MQKGPLEDLPDEVNLALSELLTLDSQLALSNTCHYFNKLIKDKFIWKKRIAELKPFLSPFVNTGLPTKENFMALLTHLHARFCGEVLFLERVHPRLAALNHEHPERLLAVYQDIQRLKVLLQHFIQDNYLSVLTQANILLNQINQQIIEWQLAPHLVTPPVHLKLEHITRLPETVLTQYTNLFAELKGLELKDNFLDTLPININMCVKLESLNVYDNPITCIPDTLRKLAELKFLYFSGGNFSKLPEVIYSLKNLQWLSLDNMQLKYISEDIQRLKQLTWLYVRNNQLIFLPLGLSKLPKLQFFMGDNNEFHPLQPKAILCFLKKHGQQTKVKAKVRKLARSGEMDILSEQMQGLSLLPQFASKRYQRLVLPHCHPHQGELKRNFSFY